MRNSLREKITILVNVHNRHKHLSRQLDYIHAHYDRILVLDSSDVEYAEKDKYRNVEYYYYPAWEYVDKLEDIVTKVKTPYVHLCADDDFYIPDSVLSCVQFLETNPDYASAHGHYLSFHWDGRHFDTRPLYINYIGRDISSNDVAVRLREALNPYIQLLYGVHRIGNLRDCFCKASASKVTNHRLVELLVTAFAVINGKHRVLAQFYGARETLYNSAGTFIPSLSKVLAEDACTGEYTRFVQLVAAYMEQKNDLSAGQAGRIFDDAFRQYAANAGRILSQLPQLLPSIVRITINRIRFRRGGLPGIGISSHDELNDIESVVRMHNISS